MKYDDLLKGKLEIIYQVEKISHLYRNLHKILNQDVNPNIDVTSQLKFYIKTIKKEEAKLHLLLHDFKLF